MCDILYFSFLAHVRLASARMVLNVLSVDVYTVKKKKKKNIGQYTVYVPVLLCCFIYPPMTKKKKSLYCKYFLDDHRHYLLVCTVVSDAYSDRCGTSWVETDWGMFWKLNFLRLAWRVIGINPREKLKRLSWIQNLSGDELYSPPQLSSRCERSWESQFTDCLCRLFDKFFLFFFFFTPDTTGFTS